ncbi:AcrR family transcriptional regulator [Microbacterium halimionae]|uniref:AcrR family transcriptional regulator n=1 Tax=Microbacterium halimionae TaxID=1526413 RepID=A0A7W3JLR6_9MICO|nr:TetR/AcrR family transcriptional regulator [Microbacterium halimionae]MBA8815184.1 AcrR family transcriptional regulator [Microbacterium halimionae]NII94025.1 AcrR family transcriptional regulator [Microbacterium halimionae]
MTDTTDAAPARKLRGEYAKTEAKREAILDAALEVFAGSGYRAGSLREVAQRVGMSEAGLLHHFKSKSALLLAVLDRRDERSLELVDFDAPDGVIGLRGLVALAAYNASVPGVVELYCVLSAEATSPRHPAHEYFINRYEYTRGQVMLAFERLQQEGRLGAGVDPARAAVATLAMMDGLQVQWLLDRNIVDMAEALKEFFRGFVSGFDMESLEIALDAHAAGA